MPLTDVAIKALRPRTSRYVISDERGLILEIHPTGQLSWRYRYRLNGKAETVSIGRYPDFSLKAARQRRDELATMVARGESPATRKRQTKLALSSDTTVQQFGERYFKDMVLSNVKNPTNIRRYLDKEIYPQLGHKAMSAVEVIDIEKVVFRKKDHGRPAAAAAIRNVLKRIFDYAIARQVVQRNPVLSIPMRFVSTPRARERNLTPDEIALYLRTLYQSNIRTQFKLGLHLILLTMARKGELLAARWKDVDLDRQEWTIPAENAKNSKPHVVYLSTQAVSLFRQLEPLASGSDLVLPGRGSLTKPFAHNAMNHALRGISFDMPAFTIHDMRRTASTRLHEAGFSSDVIEKALNHTMGGVRGVYNRAEYASQRRDMLQVWGSYVEGLISEQKISFQSKFIEPRTSTISA